VRGDAARWRAFVALAREVFDKGDAWAGGQPEPMPVLIPGAEGWATAALRRACLKGRRALDRDDVVGVVLALIETGHAGRDVEIINRWLATIDRVEEERTRRRARSRQARLADRDAKLIPLLEAAPEPARLSYVRAARWLRQKGHSSLSERTLRNRLSAIWPFPKKRPVKRTDPRVSS
jgi:hypothetical protein